jgi:hypothetical protein
MVKLTMIGVFIFSGYLFQRFFCAPMISNNRINFDGGIFSSLMEILDRFTFNMEYFIFNVETLPQYGLAQLLWNISKTIILAGTLYLIYRYFSERNPLVLSVLLISGLCTGVLMVLYVPFFPLFPKTIAPVFLLIILSAVFLKDKVLQGYFLLGLIVCFPLTVLVASDTVSQRIEASVNLNNKYREAAECFSRISSLATPISGSEKITIQLNFHYFYDHPPVTILLISLPVSNSENIPIRYSSLADLNYRNYDNIKVDYILSPVKIPGFPDSQLVEANKFFYFYKFNSGK